MIDENPVVRSFRMARRTLAPLMPRHDIVPMEETPLMEVEGKEDAIPCAPSNPSPMHGAALVEAAPCGSPRALVLESAGKGEAPPNPNPRKEALLDCEVTMMCRRRSWMDFHRRIKRVC
ncbi:UNVERIFIED_CONTAM: hypothetical protein Slati_1377600 [Sesamum latifolium]|uniref:Uncharacterized protein n=1 Tax=Sesamum latifolium TaxID=2727402 RepID=A0AAW2XJX5_9LAMI